MTHPIDPDVFRISLDAVRQVGMDREADLMADLVRILTAPGVLEDLRFAGRCVRSAPNYLGSTAQDRFRVARIIDSLADLIDPDETIGSTRRRIDAIREKVRLAMIDDLIGLPDDLIGLPKEST